MFYITIDDFMKETKVNMLLETIAGSVRSRFQYYGTSPPDPMRITEKPIISSANDSVGQMRISTRLVTPTVRYLHVFDHGSKCARWAMFLVSVLNVIHRQGHGKSSPCAQKRIALAHQPCKRLLVRHIY